MSEGKELLVKSSEAESMILGLADLSNLPLAERVTALQRLSSAQAGDNIDDFLEQPVIVVGITPYVRSGISQETGEVVQYNYVSFHLADGRDIKTASSQAFPHVMQIASILGYNLKTGELPHPYKMLVKPQKAPTGFIYRFVFLDLASEKELAKAKRKMEEAE